MSWWSRLWKKEKPLLERYPMPSGLSEQDQKRHAMRRKRIADELAAAERYGHHLLLMHCSALSPTTRKSHADRHGNLYTPEEVLAWWSQGDNAVDCRCSVTCILVDRNGVIHSHAVIESTRQTYEKMKARGKGEWTKG